MHDVQNCSLEELQHEKLEQLQLRTTALRPNNDAIRLWILLITVKISKQQQQNKNNG